MITRLVAALVALAVLLPAIVWGGVLALEIIVVLAALVCVSEYAAMAFPEDRWAMGGALALGWAGLYAGVLYAPVQLQFVIFSLVILGGMIWQTLRPGETLEHTANHTGRLVLGITWLSLLASVVLLRREEHGLAWLFLVMAISWLGDTGGYFAGKYLGSHKLYPKVSPKKTWEGVAGGVTLATMGTFAVRAIGLPELSVVDCLILGPVLCIAGVVGDLAESMLKRSFQVKDSGWIMPGHGGLLDRIDSLLFVTPLLYAWVRTMEA